MNKKIAAIIAGSVAALGSAIVAAPAHAQTANIPVEIEVQPSVYLVTYNKLKFLVNSNDLLAGGSVSQTVAYDEKAGTTTLPAGTPPTAGTSLSPVSKTVSPLFRVLAPSGGNVTVTASDNKLERTGVGASASDVVTMEVDTTTATKAIPSSSTGFVNGDVKLNFTFPGTTAPAAGATYTGGQLTISVVSP